MKSPRPRFPRTARRRDGARRHCLTPRALAFESLETRRMLAGSTIQILAAGRTGEEQIQLQIAGQTVATFNNVGGNYLTGQFASLTYQHAPSVALSQIRVVYANDGTSAGGLDRNLRVDAVVLDGVRHETEGPNVFSTGTYVAPQGRTLGKLRTEYLHLNGYFQYGAVGSVIEIFAAGKTGQEQMQLEINGTAVATYSNVGGNYATGQFQSIVYLHGSTVSLDRIRVAYVNDGITATGEDKNLRVDALTLDGVRHETEGPNVYSTGTYVAPQGRAPGYRQTEYLHLNGYFQYAVTGSVIEIRAAGNTGQEQMQLQIGGTTVATFNNVGGNYFSAQYQSFVYQHTSTVALNQIRVAFTNDGLTSTGADMNLRVDGLYLDGVFHQSEAADVFSTGTYIAPIGRAPGLWQSEFLHANGYFQYASSAVPGTIALGTSNITVNEGAGTVSIPVVRTGGSDGTVRLRYTTVDASAAAGSDYTSTTGSVVFAPGETLKTIVVPITVDALSEPDEAFNVSTDQATGGATLGQPRTVTVTIQDDDGPPAPGSGTGLLGAYYNDDALTDFVLQRTDATIDFSWGDGSPVALIDPDTYSVRWTGQLEARFTETFTFHTASDDGVRLWIDGQLVIDHWNGATQTVATGTFALVARQRYNVTVEYFEAAGTSFINLGWSSPSQPFEIIPQSQLYSTPPLPPQTGTFSGQTVASGLSRPIALDFDASGRMFIAEQRGVVRIYQNRQLLPTPFVDIQAQVNFVQDRGMLGVAVHPDFPATPYVYVAYTYDPPEAANNTGEAGRDGAGNRVARVTRFTADAATGYNTAVPGSEVVIVGSNSVWANISRPDLDSTNDISIPPSGAPNGEMRDILIADSRSHTVGNLGFGPDGMLYVANGDGTSFGRVDPRSARVQSLDSLSGKILRVDPLTGQGLADNPFFNGDADSNRSKVYDYGLRNPFRFAFQPGTGTLYVGDVGWNTWEEINIGRGQNFGWPYFEGANGTSQRTGGYQDLPEAQAFYATNPTVAAPLWARSHSAGGVAVVAGDFYTGATYPASYQNALFLTDYGDEQLRVLRTNADGSLNSVTALGLSVGIVVEMTMGRDGLMYYVDATGKVGRLIFTPVAPLITPLSASPTGDFDENNVVDGADFLAWQRMAGSPTADERLAAWTMNFGSTTVDEFSVEADFAAVEAYRLAALDVDESPVAAALEETVQWSPDRDGDFEAAAVPVQNEMAATIELEEQATDEAMGELVEDSLEVSFEL